MTDTTICIPVFNGEPWLEKLFESIYSQSVDFEFKFLCVDSGSTDGSVEIIKRWMSREDVRLVEIMNRDYGHGRTRNYIAELCDTPYVLLITQDILPTSSSWLQEMHDSIIEERKLAAVFCRHEAWPTSHPVKMRYIKRTFDDYLANIKKLPSYIERSGSHYFTDRTDIHEWDQVTAFSNVCAIYKREVMQKIPFEDVNFAEDRIFMKSAIEGGYYIGYLDSTSIYHSHDYGYRGTLMRTVDEWKAIGEQGQFPYRFRLWHVLTQALISYISDIVFCLSPESKLSPLKRLNGVFTCFFMELMIKSGMYIGLNYEKIPSFITEDLSYQKKWRSEKSK